ncbi:hypothetical protein PMZ80_004828 [Knufia obscura]|uniref:Uncharacterized protein n=1 Tax=Knufia obscura TaxID=1635080 RepID=A0ABR0RNV6_9EURO|nr:hypothetical protein PMZ80_004828 [Knufia obscura]
MLLVKAFAAVVLASGFHFVQTAPTLAQGFKNDLAIANLFISNPIQSDVTSSYNSTLNVLVIDEDYPDEKPVHCQIEWEAGTAPPDTTQYQCDNVTTRAWFPENTFKGVKNFQLQFARTVIDSTVGECPQYCYLTKYAAVNLTYPGTPNYECDTKNATCEQRVNTTIKAPVFLSVA